MAAFYDEIEIEDMDFDKDSSTYYYPCPCGDRFQISLQVPSVLRQICVIKNIDNFFSGLEKWRGGGSLSKLLFDNQSHLYSEPVTRAT